MIILYLFLFGISGGELLVLLLLVLLLFGPKKIPEIARMIGRGLNEVKKVQREINTEIHRYSSDIEKEALEMDKSIKNLQNDMANNKPQYHSKTKHPDDQKEKHDDDSNIKKGSTQTEQNILPDAVDKHTNLHDEPEKHADNNTNDNNHNDLPYPYNKNE